MWQQHGQYKNRVHHSLSGLSNTGANQSLADPGLLQSRGCFGCCAKPTPITAVDEPSKRLRIQGRSVRKASLSEDFWSTSAHEMENNGIQSQKSMSSISTVAQSSDQHVAGSSSNPNEFVNQGLMLWNQTRQQWVGSKKQHSRSQQPREPKLRKW
ncbi:uncharacterized protein [Miscanthus floridulus]|uniref:uncharacterized protein isoform X7 n=1 Tax=Miscanthus floridulus TaxID=154761 RepID=UPI003457F616